MTRSARQRNTPMVARAAVAQGVVAAGSSLGAGLSSGSDFLRDAARGFFADLYELSTLLAGSELHKDLNWTPSLRFVINDHVNVFVEPSESRPYPRIFSLRLGDVLQFPQPIAAYAVCPEELLLEAGNQGDIQRLEDHGFGLIAISKNGDARRRFAAVPLVQVISRADYKALIEGLTPRQKQCVAQAYEDYKNRPSTGVATLSEVMEGMGIQAAKDAAAKGWITNAQANGSIAAALDAMYAVPACQSARGVIGGLRHYIHTYRNLSHHWPKNKKKAYQKYGECRHAFLDGVRQMVQFRQGMRNIGLSGNLPKG